MNVFTRIGNWLVGIFKSDAAKKIMKLGGEILKAIVQSQGPALQAIALEEVRRAATMTTLSNEEKFKLAYNAIVARVKTSDIGENAVNLAIELAVAAIKKG